MRKFSTFDVDLVDFLQDKGINHAKTFIGSGKDTGYEYDYIPNLKRVLAEYNAANTELIAKENQNKKQENFEKMMDSFLKISKDKCSEAEREHTKSERTKKKKCNSDRRKNKIAKRNRRNNIWKI